MSGRRAANLADEVSVAFHEAGHVLVARALDAPIKRVSLRPDAEYFLDGLVPRATCVLVALGGPCAQQRHSRFTADERAELWETGGWRDDFTKVLRYHRYQRDGSLADAMREARRLVRQHWDAIERVAAALSERGELTGDEVDALLAEVAGRNKRASGVPMGSPPPGR
jgi:hypothetical protein